MRHTSTEFLDGADEHCGSGRTDQASCGRGAD